jgi:F0F1-type ATP synthase assembly protein I
VPDKASLQRGAIAAALVTQMAVVTVLGGLLGQLLDARFSTGPWLMTGGFVGGFVVGMSTLFAWLTRSSRTDDDDTPPDDPPA